MGCILCGKKPVIVEQQGPLCGDCFIQYFQKKVYKAIRKYRLFDKKDTLCVACSGGKDSLTVLYLTSRLAKKQRQKLFAIGVDEGVKGYREKQLEDMIYFCKKHGIDAVIVSFKEEFGHTVEELMSIAKKRKIDVNQCALCGMLRRKLLNKYAKKMGATKILVGHNLDDETQTVLMNMFKGGADLLARMGPVTGAVKHKAFIPRIKPLYFCTEEETRLFTKMKKFRVIYTRCPYRKYSYRNYVSEILDRLEKDYKGTKTTVMQNLLRILPAMKKEFSTGKIPECRQCGEPSMKDVCSVCDILGRLGIK